jgi:hypothetical protein
MRALADAERIRRFMRELGAASSRPARVYLTGGATAVLLGWRTSTIDVDLKMVPEQRWPRSSGDTRRTSRMSARW